LRVGLLPDIRGLAGSSPPLNRDNLFFTRSLAKDMKRLEKPNWQKQIERRKRIRLIAAALFLLVPLGIGSAYILNKTIADSSSLSNSIGDLQLSDPEIQGDKIFVREGQSFQKALNSAKPGDTILLEAGKTFKGSFELPNKSGSQFITIRTSANDSQLPPADKRLEPDKYKAVLPKLESNIKGKSVITTAKGAHHYRFIGIEFMPTIEGHYNIVQIGGGDETDIKDLPNYIEFDRVYIHGSDEFGQRRGIAANGRNVKIINSHISNIKRRGEESAAIGAWATDGPIIIENNYLEASGINILFGGATSPLKLTPTNCIVRNNRMDKRLEWKGTDWVVKNLFEIKNGKNIKVQNNLLTNNWLMAQDGTAVLFTVREDSGENAKIEDVEFSNNIIRGASSALNFLGYEAQGGRNVIIRNNIFDDINHQKWGGNGFFMKTSGWDGLVIENNTVIQSGSISVAYGKPTKNLVFRNNIIFRNEYGFFGDGVGEGKKAFDAYFPNITVDKNIIIGGEPSMYGSNNFYPGSIKQIGFANMENYSLRSDSPYLTKGFNGKNIGTNLDPKTVSGK
jgi:hypothetical protein